MANWNGPWARALCTDTEWTLVKAASMKEVSTQTPAALRRHAVRARKLFDKWRGLAIGQSRAVQKSRGARVAGGSERSAEKANLFAMVTERFETALARATGNGTSGKAAPAAKKTVRKKTVRKKAVAKKAAPKRTAATKATPKTAAPKRKTAPKAGAAQSGFKAAPVSKKAPRTVPAGAPRAGVPKDDAREARAAARTNKKRLRASGLETRIRGHMQSSGKRSQARRDSRN